MGKPKYLYHGSSERVDVLLPHQAQDFLEEVGTQHGIFATPNRDVALAFALGAVPDNTGGITRVITSLNPVKMVFLQGHPNFGGKGYLYTLSSDEFEEVNPLQWLCRKSVTPLETLEINVDDYLHLFRYATEEEKRKLEREFRAGQQCEKKEVQK